MAKIEKVTVFCDGPCGGNEITTGNESTFTLRRGTDANRRVDLCPDCAGLVMEIYNKGTIQKAGRKPSTPVAEVPTTAATIQPDTPVTASPVVMRDPFDAEPVATDDAPLGTGV